MFWIESVSNDISCFLPTKNSSWLVESKLNSAVLPLLNGRFHLFRQSIQIRALGAKMIWVYYLYQVLQFRSAWIFVPVFSIFFERLMQANIHVEFCPKICLSELALICIKCWYVKAWFANQKVVWRYYVKVVYINGYMNACSIYSWLCFSWKLN